MIIKAEIKMVFNNHNSRLRAIAVLIFDDCFLVKSVRLIKGRKGLFVNMPSVKNTYGGYTDICHPLDPDLKAVIDIAVIDAYHEFMGKFKPEGGEKNEGFE